MTAVEYGILGALLFLVYRSFAQAAPGGLQERRSGLLPYEGLFDRFAGFQNVPKRLLVAIADHESRFNAKAVNEEAAADKRKKRDVDSIGIMQILWPDTAIALDPAATRERLFEPAYNIEAGAKLLAQLYDRYPVVSRADFPSQVVAAYNAGSARYKADGSFVNQEYVNAVLVKWRAYSDV